MNEMNINLKYNKIPKANIFKSKNCHETIENQGQERVVIINTGFKFIFYVKIGINFLTGIVQCWGQWTIKSKSSRKLKTCQIANSGIVIFHKWYRN